MAFYAEDTVDASTVRHWVTKSRDSGGNLYLNDQPQSGRPVSATRDLNRQKVDELI
jgi:transposase